MTLTGPGAYGRRVIAPSSPTAADSEGGWEAALELGYARRGERTVPTHRRHRGPIRVQKHHEPELGVCQHILVHPPAGMAGGDSVDVDVAVGPGAHAQLTTPGATPWYRSAGPAARQSVRARVDAGATLELLPREHLVFDGAEVVIDTDVTLAADARLVMWDIVALGRPHGDAPFTRGRVHADARIWRAGALVWCDRMRLAADDHRRASALGLGGADVCATLVVAAPHRLALDACHDVETPDPAGARAGITDLGGLVIGRWLGAAVEPARRWLEAMWRALRPQAVGRAALAPRIWRT